MGGGLRYFGSALAFGFAAVWIMWSLTAALICLLAAATGYGAVVLTERGRAKLGARAVSPGRSAPSTLSPPSRTPETDDLSLQADELNSDLGHLYKPPSLTAGQDDSPIKADTTSQSEPPD